MTRHPGAPRNRLAGESSPYLLLHASNPVDWFPWGDEAFEKARAEEKPVFLSVGYSTCYWCHVMERESFSNPDIAKLLNDGFVSVKLDREERPDLDEYYMMATQLLTRQGGWPNSLFLTAEGKPFFAGTYFPPSDLSGRPGFPRVLASVREAWTERRDAVVEQAEAVAGAIRENLSGGAEGRVLPGRAVVIAAQAILARRFDPDYGGFGGAPKFPSPSNLSFLLDRTRTGDHEARDMLVLTLDAMARGGIHDQLGGGFHRYSTDAEWLVPHFEKMLYDNASLALLYAEAVSVAPDLGFGRAASRALDFVLAELRSPEGPFYSAMDAETDGDEGAYYVWTRDALKDALSREGDALLAKVFGYDGPPNFEGGRYVLHVPKRLDALAEDAGESAAAFLVRVEPFRQHLLDVRARRPRPLIDDKVLTDWNGLMIGSMARCGQILGKTRYVTAATVAAEFILERLKDKATGHLLHVYRDGVAKVPALLDDYAFLISGLLRLHEATKVERWLAEAQRLAAEQQARLGDEENGGFFGVGEDAGMPIRSKTASDGALPSGNGVSALNLLTLGWLTGDPEYTQRAGRLLEAFGTSIASYPLAHLTLVQAVGRISPIPEGVARPPAPSESAIVRVDGTVAKDAEPGEWVPFVVDIEVLEGWHLNANPASLPVLVSTELQELHGRIRDVRYPHGEVLGHLPSGEDVRVYRGRVAITGEIEGLEGEPPTVRLSYQPCDEARCLAPETLEVVLR
jgi:uncharacterized protein YyaL (SSP411 family)